MRIGDVIGPDRVVVGLRVPDKTQLLQDLAGRAAMALSIDRRKIFDALLARENLGSTGLGKGFALPHARMEGLGQAYRAVRPAGAADRFRIDRRASGRPGDPAADARQRRQSPSGNAGRPVPATA